MGDHAKIWDCYDRILECYEPEDGLERSIVQLDCDALYDKVDYNQ
jgi:hypothetical protein